MVATARKARPAVGPTTRVVAAGLFVLAAVLFYPGRLEILAGWLLVLALMATICAARPAGMALRALPALPFILLVAVLLPFTRPGPVCWEGALGSWKLVVTEPGIAAFHMVLAKSGLAVLTLAMVADTTSPAEICRALQDIRVPRLLLLVIALALRFLALMRDEITALRRARELRRFDRRVRGEWRALGHLVGTLFARATERAERVHGAMRLRGFDGEFRLLQAQAFGCADALYVALVLAASVGLGVLAKW